MLNWFGFGKRKKSKEGTIPVSPEVEDALRNRFNFDLREHVHDKKINGRVGHYLTGYKVGSRLAPEEVESILIGYRSTHEGELDYTLRETGDGENAA